MAPDSEQYHFPETPMLPPAAEPTSDSPSETDLREFFDPAGRYPDEPSGAFFDRVAATRFPAEIQGFGKLTGHEVILAESVHSLLLGGDGTQLPIGADRRHEIIEHIQTYAGIVARSVVEVADEIAEQRQQRQERVSYYQFQSLPTKFVLTGKVLAALAHAGAMRRSGRDYYSHPNEVASILSLAWDKSPEVSEDTHLRDVLRFMAYTHDAPEDNIDMRGQYVGKQALVSPLVVREVLKLQDVPESSDIARTLFMLMRTRDTDNYRMGYLDYVLRGSQQPAPIGAYFTLVKSADVRHNRSIEPDPIPIDDEKAMKKIMKRHTYEDAAVLLLRESERYDLGLLPHRIFAIGPDEIRAAENEKYPFEIMATARAVRERVRQKAA